jgi:hypothetical protein
MLYTEFTLKTGINGGIGAGFVITDDMGFESSSVVTHFSNWPESCSANYSMTNRLTFERFLASLRFEHRGKAGSIGEEIGSFD